MIKKVNTYGKFEIENLTITGIPSGNTGSISAVGGVATLGEVIFSNSNGVSFGVNGQTITASVGAGVAAGSISAGTTNVILGQAVFSNSNGIAFGLDGSTITASYTVPSVTNSSWTASDSITSLTIAQLNFTASNGLTLTMSTSNNGHATVIGSYTVPVVPAATSWTVSDAVTSQTIGRLAFTNANGLTMTLSTSNNGNATVFGSYTVPSVTNSSFSVQDSATTINPVARIAFSTGNNITLTLSTGASSATVGIAHNLAGTSTGFGGSLISGSMTHNSSGLNLSLNHPAWLTTAMVSDGGSRFVNTSAGLNLTNVSATFNSNSISLSVAAQGLTSQSNQAISAANGSFTFQTATFANSNGVSFSTGTQGVYATVATNYLTTAMVSDAGSRFVNTSAGLNLTNISATFNSNSISLNVAAQTNQTLGLYFSSNTTSSVSSGTADARSLTFVGKGILSAGYSNGSVILSVPSGGGGLTNINVSAGATSNNLSNIVFSNSNGVSFGLTGSTITASAAGGGVAIANSQTTYTSGTANLIEGGGAITIQSTTGQSYLFSVPQTSSLSGTGAVSISVNGSTISIGAPNVATLSYWNNVPFNLGNTTTMAQSNSFYVFPMSMDAYVSASYMRFLGSVNFTSSSIATSAVNNVTGASTTFSETVAFNAVIYTAGVGASSRSLQYLTSASVGWTWAATVSQASTSNASRASITQAITYPSEGLSTANVTTQYSVSATNTPISTTQWSNLSAQRFIDIPFAASMSPGNYWVAFNRISGTVGGKSIDMNATIYGNSQSNLSWGNFNAATNLTLQPQLGVGLWTTNAAQTTSIGLANISATTGYMMPYIQFIRQA